MARQGLNNEKELVEYVRLLVEKYNQVSFPELGPITGLSVMERIERGYKFGLLNKFENIDKNQVGTLEKNKEKILNNYIKIILQVHADAKESLGLNEVLA